MMGRVTGLVLATSRRKGTSGAGNPYDLTTARVLVAGQDVTPVTFPTSDDLQNGEQPPRVTKGELVDWLVDFDVYRNEANCRLVSPEFPDGTDVLDSLAALTA